MKNAHLVILLFCLTIVNSVLSQDEIHWDWLNQIHGTYQREFDYAIDNNKNIYVCGKFSGELIIGDTTISQSEIYSNNFWSFLAKYSWDGSFLWVKVQTNEIPFGSVARIHVELDNENNVYIAGRYFNQIIFDSIIMEPGMDSNTGCYLVKYNENGNLLWTAQVFGSNSDDSFADFQIDNDHIFLGTEHYFFSDTNLIIFEDIDTTTIIGHHPYFALSSFNLDGSFNWIETFYTALFSAEINKIIIDEDGILKVCGGSNDTIFVNNDTVIPTIPTNSGFNYLFKYSASGDFINSYLFTDFPISSFYDGPNSDIIISGLLYENLIINSDTLILYNPEVFRNRIIASFDEYLNPKWCNQVNAIPTSGAIPEFCYSALDSLIYTMIFFKDSCIVGNKIITNNRMSYAYIRYNNNGDLISAEELIKTDGGAAPKKFITDGCGNIFHAGHITESAVFNNDTIDPNYGDYFTFFGKLNHNPLIFDLGPDTIICDRYILEPKQQFEYYNWNDGFSTDSNLEVTETGHYWLYAMNEFECTGVDSIYISILTSPEINLGNDTTMTINDTIRLAVQNGFTSYTWQDSSTNNYFDVLGSNYLAGSYKFWVDVQDSICNTSDTVQITIIDNSNINQYKSNQRLCAVYPNPSNRQLFIDYLSKKETEVIVKIYTIYGSHIRTKIFPLNSTSTDKLEIEKMNPGVYLIDIQLNGSQSNFKIIIK